MDHATKYHDELNGQRTVGREGQDNKKEAASGDRRKREIIKGEESGPPHDGLGLGWMDQKYESLINKLAN